MSGRSLVSPLRAGCGVVVVKRGSFRMSGEFFFFFLIPHAFDYRSHIEQGYDKGP